MQKLNISSFTHIVLGFTAVVAILFIGNIIYVQAQEWITPPSNPPEGNVAPPLNTSEVEQTKAGILGASEFRSPRYCDENGTNCSIGANPFAGMYICPSIDGNLHDGSCGTTCAGQLTTSPTCTDYGQYRHTTKDRRCRPIASYACYPSLAVPANYNWFDVPESGRRICRGYRNSTGGDIDFMVTIPNSHAAYNQYVSSNRTSDFSQIDWVVSTETSGIARIASVPSGHWFAVCDRVQDIAETPANPRPGLSFQWAELRPIPGGSVSWMPGSWSDWEQIGRTTEIDDSTNPWTYISVDVCQRTRTLSCIRDDNGATVSNYFCSGTQPMTAEIQNTSNSCSSL